MTENSKAIISVLVVLLVASVIGNFYLYKNLDNGADCPNNDLNCPQLEEKAILKVDMYQWGVNLYDQSEFLFDYWMINYGDSEAKDIKVRCKLSNPEQGVVFSGLHNYGNIASLSGELGEFTPKKSTAIGYDSNKEYTAYCYVESCDNCEILYKRIPALIETYEKGFS